MSRSVDAIRGEPAYAAPAISGKFANPARGNDAMQVVVESVLSVTPTIRLIRLVDAKGQDLPPFSPGAHIDITLKSGLVRQYSLCGPVAERNAFQVAVKLVQDGRGGSKEIHDGIRPGDVLSISNPRNHFPLKDHTGPRVLIAGGIGITPVLPMARQLLAEGVPFFLYYSVRSRKDALFLAEIEALEKDGRAAIFVNDEADRDLLDIEAVFAKYREHAHIYCCGPASLMSAVRERAVARRHADVFFESFGTEPHAGNAGSGESSAENPEGAEFHVVIGSSGQVVPVKKDESILEALENRGIEVESSCRAGTCGTCKVRYTRGNVSHKDYFLFDEEQAEFIMICVSRGSGEVELDL